MKRISTAFCILVAFILTPLLSSAQVKQDTILLKPSNLKINQLKTGLSRYLVYIEKTDGSLFSTTIWERETKLENDKIIVNQIWKTTDTSRVRHVYSISNKKDFTPIYHYTKMGSTLVEAFDFKHDKIVGSDTVKNNSKQSFKIPLSEPSLNWELDLEIFQTLPYAMGKTFALNFYHPGGKAQPNNYYYSVIGKEPYRNYSCWLLQIDYGKGNNATFWIDENTFEVVKMEEKYGAITRYKVKFEI